jgi:hypothetical protein
MLIRSIPCVSSTMRYSFLIIAVSNVLYDFAVLLEFSLCLFRLGLICWCIYFSWKTMKLITWLNGLILYCVVGVVFNCSCWTTVKFETCVKHLDDCFLFQVGEGGLSIAI